MRFIDEARKVLILTDGDLKTLCTAKVIDERW